jgi:hypothetical protein
MIEGIPIELNLTPSEWCELANAVSGKAIQVKRGDYGENDEWDDGFDKDAWAEELSGIYEKITKVLDERGVMY